MEEFDPAEDFVSPAAAKLMDTAFGLNGMARWIATEAQIMEHRERARLRKQAQRNRERTQQTAPALSREDRLTG